MIVCALSWLWDAVGFCSRVSRSPWFPDPALKYWIRSDDELPRRGLGGKRQARIAGVETDITACDRVRLETIVADRSSPQRHVWRAYILLATAESCSTAEIVRLCVWHSPEGFIIEAVDELLRGRMGLGARPAQAQSGGRCGGDPAARRGAPDGASQWTAPALGVSVSSLQGIWRTHGLRPHQIRTFKLFQTPRHDHALRRRQHARWDGSCAVHETSPQPRVLPLSQRGRGRGSSGKVIHVVLDNYAAQKQAKIHT